MIIIRIYLMISSVLESGLTQASNIGIICYVLIVPTFFSQHTHNISSLHLTVKNFIYIFLASTQLYQRTKKPKESEFM